MDVDTQGCVGLCCACFNLKGRIPAVVASQDPENAVMILSMLKPLPMIDAENGWQMWTCRNWDRETKLCTIYEDRPQMCRNYPNESSPCGWEGCKFDA